MDHLGRLLKPQTGIITSITVLPTKETTMELIGADRFLCWLGAALDAGEMYYKWKL